MTSLFELLPAVHRLRDAAIAGTIPAEQGPLEAFLAAVAEQVAVLDESIEQAIRDRLRTTYSPRHVPDRIVQVTSIPYTLTGKKLEVPVRRILSGVPEERAANRAAMADPAALDFFIEYARTQRDYSFGS